MMLVMVMMRMRMMMKVMYDGDALLMTILMNGNFKLPHSISKKATARAERFCMLLETFFSETVCNCSGQQGRGRKMKVVIKPFKSSSQSVQSVQILIAISIYRTIPAAQASPS